MAIPAAYVAFKSWDTSIESPDHPGWLHTGRKVSEAKLPLTEASGEHPEHSDAPPDLKYYGDARSVVAKVDREYDGINSSGGPQVTGRCDHSDLVMVRYSDKASPFLFQYCCTGEQFSTVFITFLDPPIHWVLSGVNVTGYEFTGDKSSSTKYLDVPIPSVGIAIPQVTDTAATAAAAAAAIGNQTGQITSYTNTWGTTNNYRRLERVTLLYTSINFECDGVGPRGWDTGTDSVLPPPPQTSN